MIKVGCCGYPVSKKIYHETFSLVELNRTFYEYPNPPTVIRWRKGAPEAFEFTVKAHQDISHKYKLVLEQAQGPFKRMMEICQILNAKILLIQTAPSFKPVSLGEAERFLGKINRDGLTLVWETRGPLWEEAETREQLRTVLERLDVTHVTDPFRIMPAYTGRTVYFRLHGLGERIYYYQYTDGELLRLYDLVKPLGTGDRDIYVFFNNLSMFEDAKRFVSLIKHGFFPSLTRAKGLDSVRAVVSKTRYPSTKDLLMRKIGWKLVELEDGSQVKLEGLLKDLPSKTYKNVEEVIRDIRL